MNSERLYSFESWSAVIDLVTAGEKADALRTGLELQPLSFLLHELCPDAPIPRFSRLESVPYSYDLAEMLAEMQAWNCLAAKASGLVATPEGQTLANRYRKVDRRADMVRLVERLSATQYEDLSLLASAARIIRQADTNEESALKLCSRRPDLSTAQAAEAIEMVARLLSPGPEPSQELAAV